MGVVGVEGRSVAAGLSVVVVALGCRVAVGEADRPSSRVVKPLVFGAESVVRAES